MPSAIRENVGDFLFEALSRADSMGKTKQFVPSPVSRKVDLDKDSISHGNGNGKIRTDVVLTLNSNCSLLDKRRRRQLYWEAGKRTWPISVEFCRRQHASRLFTRT
jgi:hypothetical protein